MKKINDYGYMLIETLLVTMFVAGVLIFLFVQFSNLSNSYDESFKYNTVENIYALEDIKNYFESDSNKMGDINDILENGSAGYIIYNESNSTEDFNFKKLLNLEQIEILIITTKSFDSIQITSNFYIAEEKELIDFIKKVESNTNEGKQKYRMIAKFKDSMGHETYATLRFGDVNE